MIEKTGGALPDYIGDLDAYHSKIPNGLYMYLLNEGAIGGGLTESQAEEVMLIPPLDVIQSVVSMPYSSTSDFTLRKVQLSEFRFPFEGLGLATQYYNRIVRQVNDNKQVGTFTRYNVSKNIGGNRHWQNEGKLYQFPFMYGIITDNISSPMEIKYHLCGSSEVWARIPLTNFGTYSLYVQNYKKDTFGQLEMQVGSSSNQIPLVSNAYSNYMSYNKASHTQAKTNTLISGVVGLGGAIATGNIGGGVSAIGNTALGISNSLAKERDLKDSPNSLVSNGNADLLFGLKSNHNEALNHFRIGLTEVELQKLGDYFAMYGYKQNKLMRVDISSRHYYNYIKTLGCNIKSSKVPSNHLNKIKTIMDNGLTFWHIDNDGVEVGNYSKDNMEV